GRSFAAASPSWPSSLAQLLRQLAAGAEQQHAHAGLAEAGGRRELAVGVALNVGQPEQLPLARAEHRPGGGQRRFRIPVRGPGGGGGDTRNQSGFGYIVEGGRGGAAPVVAQQVGGGGEQKTAAGHLAFVDPRGAEETD